MKYLLLITMALMSANALALELWEIERAEQKREEREQKKEERERKLQRKKEEEEYKLGVKKREKESEAREKEWDEHWLRRKGYDKRTDFPAPAPAVLEGKEKEE